MKTNTVIKSILYIFYIVIITLCFIGVGNTYFTTYLSKNSAGVSASTNQSKEEEFLIRHLKVKKQFYNLGDSIEFKITDSFLEKNWHYYKNKKIPSKNNELNNNQLIVKYTTKSNLNGLNITWFICTGDKSNRMYETSRTGLALQNNSIKDLKLYIMIERNGNNIIADSLEFY